MPTNLVLNSGFDYYSALFSSGTNSMLCAASTAIVISMGHKYLMNSLFFKEKKLLPGNGGLPREQPGA